MRVMFADRLPESAIRRLEAAGMEVTNTPTLSGRDLVEAIERVDPAVLVVRSTKVDKAHIVVAKALSLVVRAGAGVNNIDRQACSAKGIYVSNCPGKNAVAVAELTIGLMVAIDRRLADNVADLRAGRWRKGTYAKAKGLKGRTLGVLGTGQIGREVIRRALGLDMQVVAWSRSLTPDLAESLGVERAVSPTDVARRCDVLSVHLALNDDTRGLVDGGLLAALPDGATVINTSRAPVVDEDALLEALDGRGFWAGLDVFSDEPAAKDAAFSHRLAGHPQVYGTHHIGASTTQAQEAVATEACRIILSYLRTGRADNCVNLTRDTAADHCLVVRHLDRVGVLAGVLELLREAEINVQEMENTIFAGGGAASARIQCAGKPPLSVMKRLESSDAILQVSLVPIGRSS
jgi:D-3-phosphoglycerate dehydrogenase